MPRTALAVIPAFALSVLAPLQAQELPSPSKFLGIQVGADRVLADYTQISAYFKALASQSPRVVLESLGKTTQGRDMLMAIISSPENLKALPRHQEIARKLADPRGLDPVAQASLIKEGKAILLVTCSLHASEIAASQMALEWAHGLATAQDEETRRRLDNVILLVVPSLNPDGHDMEVSWYRKHLGTPYEGSSMPWLYHWYTGHDNNRDWVCLTQKESQIMNRAVYHTWNPQVWFDQHQMGSTSARLFLPPYTNPVSATVHPLTWRELDAMGTFMSMRLEQAGKTGVGHSFAFDAYWPGGTKNTAWFKNITGILSEMASVRLATPIEVHPTELSGMGKGLVDYKRQVNFPNPWKGGVWRMRDIMDYERIFSDAMLEYCADRRADLLRNKLLKAQDSIAQGSPDRWWRIPARQTDPPTARKLARILLAHEVDVFWHEGEKAWYIPSSQPYGRFVKEIFDVNRYPEVRMQPGGGVLAPYDVTAWSLPLHMGVEVSEVRREGGSREGLRPATTADGLAGGLKPGAALYALGRETNAATALLNAHLKAGGKATVALAPVDAEGRTYPAGTFLLEPHGGLAGLAEHHGISLPGVASTSTKRVPQRAARVGLYKSYRASMDEGWTRFLLDEAGFAPTSLDNPTIKAGKLRERLDVIILPNQTKATLVEGTRAWPAEGPKSLPDLPEAFTGGIGKEGLKALHDFVEAGGTLVAMGGATEVAMEEFSLPVRNGVNQGEGPALQAPGTLVKILVDATHPVAWGMPREAHAFIQGREAFQTSLPRPDITRSVVAQYPDDAQDILVSGYMKGGERLERKVAAVAFELSAGKVVLFGFAPQHRAQTDMTFKLLYNALHWSALGKP